MNNEIFDKIEVIQEACRNEDGERIAVPLLKRIQSIDGELYAYVDDFLNEFGGKLDENIKVHIEEKFLMVN
ncbi:hypothetical protein ACQKMD_01440 [Viridibacillus sp. NPDC096237]|uniref:hypothetical protein n=1 Tax=Viridibacillus sp. NPDC096237 TaxID=3390721 RepID=UPI003D08889F